jgi:hypothetical protein
VGVAAYYVVENRKVLPAAEAGTLISESLKSDGPVTIHFKTGMVVASVQDRPHDPNYRLLEKAGLVNIGKDKGRATPVTLTAAGRKMLANIPGVKQNKDEKDGTLEYVVPVAERKLVGSAAPRANLSGPGPPPRWENCWTPQGRWSRASTPGSGAR